MAAAGLPQRLRAAVESGLPDLKDPKGRLGPKGRLRLSKERLNDLQRCEGLFQSGLIGERPPFELSFKSASGTLLHKAVELEVGARERASDPLTDPEQRQTAEYNALAAAVELDVLTDGWFSQAIGESEPGTQPKVANPPESR